MACELCGPIEASRSGLLKLKKISFECVSHEIAVFHSFLCSLEFVCFYLDELTCLDISWYIFLLWGWSLKFYKSKVVTPVESHRAAKGTIRFDWIASPFSGTEMIYLVRSGFRWSTVHLSQSACPLPSQVQGSRHEPGSLLPHQRGSCPRGNPRQRISWCLALSDDHIWSPGMGFHQRSAGSHPARPWMPAEWLHMNYTLQF